MMIIMIFFFARSNVTLNVTMIIIMMTEAGGKPGIVKLIENMMMIIFFFARSTVTVIMTMTFPIIILMAMTTCQVGRPLPDAVEALLALDLQPPLSLSSSYIFSSPSPSSSSSSYF